MTKGSRSRHKGSFCVVVYKTFILYFISLVVGSPAKTKISVEYKEFVLGYKEAIAFNTDFLPI